MSLVRLGCTRPWVRAVLRPHDSLGSRAWMHRETSNLARLKSYEVALVAVTFPDIFTFETP